MDITIDFLILYKKEMEKEFVPYDRAVKLKSLEFDEPCLAYYQKSAVIGDDTILPIQIRDQVSNFNDDEYSKLGVPFWSAPTFSQAFRWFREKYNLFGCIDLHPSTPIHWYIRIDDVIENDYIYHSEDEGLKFGTYEMGELACLNKLIEIVESQKTK